MRPEKTAEDFWQRVAIGAPDECWPWMGGTTKSGHGKASFYAQTNGMSAAVVLAHRVAWTLTQNPLATKIEVPDGFIVRHSCDNPPCCNPAHLILGTKADNTDDMMERGRNHWLQQTHCKNGHSFTEHGVLRVRKSGRRYRHCRACRRVRV